MSSGMISPGRLLYLVKRRLALGFVHGYAEHFIEPEIQKWRQDPTWPMAEVPIHVLTSKHDWKMAMWMLASFHHFTKHRWSVILHEDGSLGEKEFSVIKSSYPNVRIWQKNEADLVMSQRLENFPHCRAYRSRMPHAIKAFDVPQLTDSPRFLLFDPDVLFFKEPQEIMTWVSTMSDDSCWFNQDFQEPSPIPERVVAKDYGFRLWSRVNSGLCLLNKYAVNNLEAMDYWLQNPLLQKPDIQWRVEQTLLALCAAKSINGGLLPPVYEVSNNRHRDSHGVSRHYVGCVRDRFVSEGLIELRGLARSNRHK